MKWKKLTNCTETDTNQDHDHFQIEDDQTADIAKEAIADTDHTAEVEANTNDITEIITHTVQNQDHVAAIQDTANTIVVEAVVNTNHLLTK